LFEIALDSRSPEEDVFMLLKDRIALVTGSTHNIGLGIARAFSREGAKVIVHSRHEEDAKKIADEIGGDHCVADVANPAELAALFGHIRKQHGRLDILVNSVAHSTSGGVLDVSLDEWNRIMTVNLTGYFLCIQHAGKIMKEKGGGAIVNISAGSGERSTPAVRPTRYPKARSMHSPAKRRLILRHTTSESMVLSPVSSAHR
jgi:NAD(P)-dependent dehydrogenase (short-subunit alcohol dehydrogenase family)